MNFRFRLRKTRTVLIPFLILSFLSFFAIDYMNGIARYSKSVISPKWISSRNGKISMRSDSSESNLHKFLPSAYLSNLELQNFLFSFSKKCSRISRLYSIGKSVNGTELWVLEISNNPGVEEAKPSFKFVGNIHGDEPVARYLLPSFAIWLCENHGQNHQADIIINDIHLHLLISMNPDGFMYKRRENANRVDLNRDFPDQWRPMNSNESARQPEVMAVMKWSKAIRFVASANFHEGALVANYPWDAHLNDSGYAACPDDFIFRHLALLYSSSHANMWNSSTFKQGITNGGEWYPVYGSMQDWTYIHTHCLELTIEAHLQKSPNVHQLEKIWEEHFPAMLSLVLAVAKSSLHGKIFSCNKKNPLPALIKIVDTNSTVIAGEKFGDFYIMLPPGRYEIEFYMPGFHSISIQAMLSPNSSTQINVALSPLFSNNTSFECYSSFDSLPTSVHGLTLNLNGHDQGSGFSHLANIDSGLEGVSRPSFNMLSPWHRKNQKRNHSLGSFGK